jgi:Ca-activated chloride channel homolog
MMRSSILQDAWCNAQESKQAFRRSVWARLRLTGVARLLIVAWVAWGLAAPAKAQAPDAPTPKVPASDAIPKRDTKTTPPQAIHEPNPPRLSDAQAKISVNTSLVVLPVTVKDRSGNLVPDLRREEFRVFEDNVEQKIDVFTAEAFPLSMVILIDNDLKTKDADEVKGSLEAIVGGMSLEDEAFICRFDQFFHPGLGFTRDQDQLLTQLERTTKQIDSEPSGVPSGGAITNGPSINGHSPIGDQPNTYPATIQLRAQSTKALDDAVFGAAELLHDRGRTRRKIILLISDGANGGKKTNKMNYDTVVRTLNQENIAVYSVAVASAFFDRKFSRLVDYAHDSGGDVYFAAKRDTLQDLYARITEEARNQYTLAYVPHGTNRALESHSIEVRIRREGLTIQTRDRYYTDAVPGATRR